MHFPEEIERTKSVAVDTVLFDQVKYSISVYGEKQGKPIDINSVVKVPETIPEEKEVYPKGKRWVFGTPFSVLITYFFEV